MNAPRVPLSVFVTTFNNAGTLARCLQSVAFAEDLVVLDSHSTDASREIAEQYGARVFVEPFKGYGPQKQSALDKTSHRWVLLLDADEELSAAAREEIERVLRAPQAAGYSLPRIEQMFWTWPHPRTRHNRYLRLFDKQRGRISMQPVHAAPTVDGPVEALAAPFLHYGEPDIETKVAKLNAYSTGLVVDKQARAVRGLAWRLLLNPPFLFVKTYLGKGHWRNGWAGLIHAVCMGFYGFLKYAKLLESRQRAQRPPAA